MNTGASTLVDAMAAPNRRSARRAVSELSRLAAVIHRALGQQTGEIANRSRRSSLSHGSKVIPSNRWNTVRDSRNWSGKSIVVSSRLRGAGRFGGVDLREQPLAQKVHARRMEDGGVIAVDHMRGHRARQPFPAEALSASPVRAGP